MSQVIQDSHLQTMLKRAVVKILHNGIFKGTAFFISPRHLLTAYHCVQFFGDDNGDQLFVENTVYGRSRVLLDREKSFPSDKIDIAVLTLAPEIIKKITDYLPLGLITENNSTDAILAVGYPAEILSVLNGKIHGFPEQHPRKFFNNVMKAEGQSGGPVYDLATQCVVGLALSVYSQEVLKEGGLAGRFDILFEQWPELSALNQQAIDHWQHCLTGKKMATQENMKQPETTPQWLPFALGGMTLIVIGLVAKLVFFQPDPPDLPIDDPPPKIGKNAPSVSKVQDPLPTTLPVSFVRLNMSNIDAIEGETHVINFAPPKKMHLARLNNPNEDAVQISLIGFPEQFFYTNLTHESSRIDAQSEKDFHLVFMFDIPDKSEFQFEIKDSHNKRIIVHIHLAGDWNGYISNKLSQFRQQISAIPPVNSMQLYEAAKQVMAEEYKESSLELKEALTGQLLTRVDQPRAAAIAYAKAEQTVPKMVERMVTTVPVIVALAKIHHENQDYSKAASWYTLAAQQNDAEAQYALGELYESGKGVEKDSEKAQNLFESSAQQGHSQVFQDPLKDGGLGPKMVWIPKGPFNMGSDKGDDDEKPVHKVTIEYDYAMSQYEVTFDDYDRFCEATGRAKPEDVGWGRGQRPVINVSWNDAKAYTQWLTEQTGKSYRLPSEAEWEYACRAGTTTAYSFGDDASQLGTYAWYNKNSEGKTHPVGEKKPNAFGLYDMHGNVWEWLEDVWHLNYEGAPVDGSAWVSGGTSNAHPLRGGSWVDNGDGLRCADRGWNNSSDRDYDGGLRLSRM